MGVAWAREAGERGAWRWWCGRRAAWRGGVWRVRRGPGEAEASEEGVGSKIAKGRKYKYKWLPLLSDWLV